MFDKPRASVPPLDIFEAGAKANLGCLRLSPFPPRIQGLADASNVSRTLFFLDSMRATVLNAAGSFAQACTCIISWINGID